MATIKTWSDYLEVVQQHAGATNVFRGENKDSFELKPSVGRERASKRSHSEIMEKQLLENFSQKIALLVETNRLDDWDTMAFAQHVGVPTRLLDWSLSPLVALFLHRPTSEVQPLHLSMASANVGASASVSKN
jgi:hypothetical protein